MDFYYFQGALTFKVRNKQTYLFCFLPHPSPQAGAPRAVAVDIELEKNMFGEFHETGLRKICLRANITGQGSFEISLKLDGR